MPALDATSKAFAFAHTGNIDQFSGFEVLYQHAVADFRFVLGLGNAHFLEHFHRRDIGLFEVAGHGFVDALRLDEFHETQLRGVVAVLVLGTALDNDTRPRL